MPPGKFRPHVNPRIASLAAAIARDHPPDVFVSTIAENVAKCALQFALAATLLRDACALMCDVQAHTTDASGAHTRRVNTVFTHMSRIIEESMAADLQEHLEVIVLVGAAISDRDEAKEQLHRIARGLGLSTHPLAMCEDAAVLEPDKPTIRKRRRPANDDE